MGNEENTPLRRGVSDRMEPVKSKKFSFTSIIACAMFACHFGVAQTIDATANQSIKKGEKEDSATRLYSVRFILTCANGPCAAVYYTVCYPSDVSAIGETDAQGRTAYYETDEPKTLKLLLGHHAPNDCGDKNPLDIGVSQEVRSK